MKSGVAAAAVALAMLSGCAKQEPTVAEEFLPIGFGSATLAGTQTSGTKAGGADFGRDFVVCGIKTLGSGEKQFVFPGYEVRYQNQSYDYISASQTVRYWDALASSYTFWGYSPKEKAEVLLSDEVALTDELTPSGAQNFHYSDVETVQPSDFGKPVCLRFGRLASMVRFGFYETLDGMGIKDLAFSVSGHFLAKASYLLSAQGISLKSSTAAQSLTVNPLPGPLQSGNTPTTEGKDVTAWQPVLPLVDTDLTVTIESCTFTKDGSDRTLQLVNPITVAIPQEYSHWDPNRDYTYIFKISTVDEDFNQIIFSFDHQIIRDWVDNGAETIYDFQP